MWIEICSDSQKDWNDSLQLAAHSFKDSAPFRADGESEEERIKFLHAYFKCYYEAELSNGRAGLICAKEKNWDGSISIVYASCFIHRIEPSDGDPSVMIAINAKAADHHARADDWIEKEIIDKMKQASQDLNISLTFGALTMCRVDRMRTGLGLKFADKFVDLFHAHGIERGYYDKDKPCVFFCVVDDANAIRFQRRRKHIEIAHLHVLGEPQCGLDDPSYHGSSNCIYVFARVLGSDLDVKKAFTPCFECAENVT